jgi:hypothetical protein
MAGPTLIQPGSTAEVNAEGGPSCALLVAQPAAAPGGDTLSLFATLKSGPYLVRRFVLAARANVPAAASRVLTVETVPGATGWTCRVRRVAGTGSRRTGLRVELETGDGPLGSSLIGNAVQRDPAGDGFALDTGVAPGATAVPAGAVVTHIALIAGGAPATLTIAAQAAITTPAGIPFELPPGALDGLVGPVTITFGGSITSRLVTWRF